MGKGDKSSRRGKIFSSSYGNVRPHKKRVVKRVARVAPTKKVVTGGKKTKDS